MKKINGLIIWGVCCGFLVLWAGCASSTLVDVWSEPAFKTSLNKILVISAGKEQARRRIWEDTFCEELTKHGVVAMPSYRFSPDAYPDSSRAILIVESNGFDGVLVIRGLPSETRSRYVEGYVTSEQVTRYNPRWDAFMTYYRDIEYAGYVESQTVDIRSIDVWSTKNDGQLIWSATSKTPEPNSTRATRPEIVSLVMHKLTKKGIIGAER